MKLLAALQRLLVIFVLISLAGEIPTPPAVQSKVAAAPFLRYVPLVAWTDPFTPLGPDGGSFTVFAASPSSPRRMYAGTWGGGVYSSADSGQTWQPANAGLGNIFIQSLAVDPKNADVVYAGTYTKGVYKTTDGGLSWKQASSGLNANAIPYDIQVDPVSTNNIYAGTRSGGSSAPPWGGGVFKSTNGGASWSAANNGLAEDWVYGLSIDPKNPTTVYAALHTQGIAKSTDGGKNWKSINSGLDDLSGRTVVVDPSNPQIVYFGTWHYGVTFKSTNGGASWLPARSGDANTKIYKLFIDPVDPRILYAATFLKGIYRTTNSAGSWSLIGFGQEFVASMGVDIANHATVFAGITGSGLFRTANGGQSWVPSEAGLRAANVLSVAVDPNNSSHLYAGISTGGASRSTDGGQNWQTINTGVGVRTVAALAVPPNNPQVVYLGTDLYGVLKSTNGGSSFLQANAGITTLARPAPRALDGRLAIGSFTQTVLAEESLGAAPAAVETALGTVSYTVQALVIDPKNPNILFMGTDSSGVYKSSNAAGSWSQSGLGGKPVYALTMDPTNSAYVYAATDGPSGSLWKTKDGGATWNQRYGGLQNLTVYAVWIDPANVSRMMCGTSNGLYFSTNIGVDWVPIGLSGKAVYAVAGFNAELVAGAVDGVYFSADSGKSWVKRSPGTMQITSLVQSNQPDSPLYFGSIGWSVWKYDPIQLP